MLTRLRAFVRELLDERTGANTTDLQIEEARQRMKATHRACLGEIASDTLNTITKDAKHGLDG